MTPEPPRLLNVGCGSHWHPKWTNIDLASASPEVQQCDLRRGIPFGAESFDAVYHSHVLEHLAPRDGRALLRECWRVLRPGGVLLDLRPIAVQIPVERVDPDGVTEIGRIDGSPGLPEDLACDRALRTIRRERRFVPLETKRFALASKWESASSLAWASRARSPAVSEYHTSFCVPSTVSASAKCSASSAAFALAWSP